MYRAGIADLPLHNGRAPRWLFSRMKKLAKALVTVIVEEYGERELLKRISDPYWFQALGCVLGFDWHSSGITTVVSGALREVLDGGNLGLKACGGKGKKALEAPREIQIKGEELGLSSHKIRELKRASFLAAKVDNAVLQDGYSIYHHLLVMSERGDWAVVQQGMRTDLRYARRYHWIGENLQCFVVEPHSAIVGPRREREVLNMVALESEGARRASVDLSREKPDKLASLVAKVRHGTTLERWLWGVESKLSRHRVEKYLKMPWNINWKALKIAYEVQPSNYEELIGIRGIGPGTIRGLALISELVYGEDVSWRDPVKFSFAFGGKDGVPFPVRREDMDSSIQFLEESIRMAELGDRERLDALKRLRALSGSLI